MIMPWLSHDDDGCVSWSNNQKITPFYFITQFFSSLSFGPSIPPNTKLNKIKYHKLSLNYFIYYYESFYVFFLFVLFWYVTTLISTIFHVVAPKRTFHGIMIFLTAQKRSVLHLCFVFICILIRNQDVNKWEKYSNGLFYEIQKYKKKSKITIFRVILIFITLSLVLGMCVYEWI